MSGQVARLRVWSTTMKTRGSASRALLTHSKCPSWTSSTPNFKPGISAFSTRSCLLAKKFTRDHEWVELDAHRKQCTMGITEYAANALGDVVYIELPEEGSTFTQGDVMGAVESVKSASEILAPVSGTVVEVNSSVNEQPGLLNKKPLDDAWIAKLSVGSAEEIDGLLTQQEYEAFIQEEN